MNEIARTENALPATQYIDPFLNMVDRAARDPAVDIDKLERLLLAREREEARKGARAFSSALVAAQAELQPVNADSGNPQTRSRYASYAALDRVVRPVYTKYGFGLSFTTEEMPSEQVRVICHVCHAEGHTQDYHIVMPVDGKGARGGDVMTKTHAMGSGVSYGRRYLLQMIFNLAVDSDDDGNAATRKYQQPMQQQRPPAQQMRQAAPPAPNVMAKRAEPDLLTNMREGRPLDAPAQPAIGRTMIADPGKPAYWSDTGEVVESAADGAIKRVYAKIDNYPTRSGIVVLWNTEWRPHLETNGCTDEEIDRAKAKLTQRAAELEEQERVGA